nr:MAG TPA: hypothetical protein [Caudoviricetes sp.]
MSKNQWLRLKVDWIDGHGRVSHRPLQLLRRVRATGPRW